MQLREALSSALAAFVICLITLPASAQSPQYDPKTEVTIEGTVEEVQQQMPATPRGRGPMGGMGGTHLKLTTQKGPMDIHLGPSSYLAEKKFTINKGDSLEITGSLVKIEGKDAVIAREVKKGKDKLVLRDANGMPLWSGYLSR
jgi:DNA/RNA endonuclease YhcR with UshA esterase domain